MKLVEIYECFCDNTRLRILNLLCSGALCVCHIQEILGEPQVKISRHLNYLKTRGAVEVRREANWMIYNLPEKQSPAFAANIACFRDCAGGDKIFKSDNAKLAKVRARLSKDTSSAAAICCAAANKSGGGKRR